MRRREKFILAAAVLSLSLLALQLGGPLVAQTWRLLGLAALTVLAFLVSGFALSEDLEWYEWLTLLPLTTLYSFAFGWFYFLLPVSVVSAVVTSALFGVGMYGLLLTCNIWSVAKGRSIQLLHAAQAVGLVISLITSLLLVNTALSLGWSLLAIMAVAVAGHWVLSVSNLWAIGLEPMVSSRVVVLSWLVTWLVVMAVVLVNWLPLSIWYRSLLVMGWFYVVLGLAQTYLQGRLFGNTLREYGFALLGLGGIFVALFPGK